MLRILVSFSLAWISAADISVDEVHAAQEAWGSGIVEIGARHTRGEDYVAYATKFVDKQYSYGERPVLFKPTMAAETRTHEHHEFRLTRESAISYMVGGNRKYSEDHGFALKPWTNVRFLNAGILYEDGIALAMGDYYFTDKKGAETKVEYTFGYTRDKHSRALRIVLHHSSIPFKPKEFEGPDPVQTVVLVLAGVVLFYGGVSIMLAKSDNPMAPLWARQAIRGHRKSIIKTELDDIESPTKYENGDLASTAWTVVKTRHGRQEIMDVIMDSDNWRAGVTVALVSVPLSISLGIASGSSPTRGLATAVFGGISAGFFGASDYNIVGPAGALSGMLMAYTVRWSEDVLPWMCFISCGFIIMIRLCGLHQYAELIPNTVFEGFTLAVAATIGLGQINFAFGVSPAKKHEHFMLNVMESLSELGNMRIPSFIVFSVTASLLLVLMRKYAKVPWTIVIPLLSLPMGYILSTSGMPFDLLTLKSKYGNLESRLIHPLYPLPSVVSSRDMFHLVLNSGGVAIVATLETLISAKIASARVGRPFDEGAEVRGLAVAHFVCGAAGAMPPTGVFVRTALNTSLGATHRFAQVLNSCVVGLIALVFMPVFLYLPQGTIAAILVVASLRMAPVEYLQSLMQTNLPGLGLCLITAVICVISDPVVGLLVGTCIHLFFNSQSSLKPSKAGE